MFVIADRVQETASSPGTGAVTLLGASTGFQSFSSGIGANNSTFYVIADQSGPNWEVGLGAINGTGTVLTRSSVYSSSNGGGTVNFASGTQNVWCDYPSETAAVQNQPVNFTSIGASTPGTGAFTNLTASGNVTFTSTGAVTMPVGSTGQEPGTPATGMLRFNSTISQFEGYNGTVWSTVGGPAITNDTTTNSTEYPLFSSTTSGYATQVYTSNANYTYNPSTGNLNSLSMTATNGMFYNANTIPASVTVASGSNAGSFGPMTIPNGVVVTVASGAVWTIA